MTIPFKELAGSPEETYSSNGLVAERKLLCAWDDRHALVAELLGEGCGLDGLCRASYPGQSAILVKRVKVEPFYGRPDDQGAFNDVDVQLNTYTGQLAALTVEYELTDISALAGMLTIEEGTFVTYRTNASVERIGISADAMSWEESSQATVSADVVPSRRMPIIQHQITWHGVTQPPWDLIRTCSGCVNASEFLGAAAETLLFDGVTADREFIQLDSTGKATYAWRLNYTFRERTIKYASSVGATPLAYGWNHAYRSTGGCERLVDANGARLYPTVDFSSLLSYPEESSSL
jgi:hypothetical protein